LTTALASLAFSLGIVFSAAAQSDRYITVALGQQGGTAWTLQALVSGAGTGSVEACFSITTRHARTVASKGCGQFVVSPRAPADPFFGMSERATASCPFGLAYGAVVSSARHIQLTLGSGRVVTASTTAPPRGLPADVRFYTVAIPCNDSLGNAVARSGSGKVVARLSL
jgi:hypothetical protein